MVETGSLAAAASNLKVSQAVAADGILRLEDQVGHQLFCRNTAHIQVSEQGRLLYSHLSAKGRS
jgi:DNA-binding transcriptional LysR family regulator